MLLVAGRRVGAARVVVGLIRFLDRGVFVAVCTGQVSAVPTFRMVADQHRLSGRNVVADGAGRLPAGVGAGRRTPGGVSVVVGAICGPLATGRLDRRDVDDRRLVDLDRDRVSGGAQRAGQLVDPPRVRASSAAVAPEPGSVVADVVRPADPMPLEDR